MNQFQFFHVHDRLDPSSPSPEAVSLRTVSSFRPSIAIVIGILSIMFTLTFLLLMYAKFCNTTADLLLRSRNRNGPNQHGPDGLIRTTSRFSGIDKTVIESLPFFRFSTLKGSREGLECVVCLSKFEDAEILRLLPKCKHAFHLSCVDQWLEKHSSCPLCRYKVGRDDVNDFTYSSSMRFSGNQSDLSDDPNVELFVRRELDADGSSRFSVGSSFRMMIDKEGMIPSRKLGNTNRHEVVESDVMLKNRWSDVTPSDLVSLNSEMLNIASTTKFSSDSHSSMQNNVKMKIKEEMERRRFFDSKVRLERSHSASGSSHVPFTFEDVGKDNPRLLVSSGKRSMSDITKLSRFANHDGPNRNKGASPAGNGCKEETERRLWLLIARRTVEWIAGRERRSKELHNSGQLSLV